MGLTIRCKCSQIKYENHTDKNTNLHQLYSAPIKTGRKTNTHGKMNKIWVQDMCVNAHKSARVGLLQ